LTTTDFERRIVQNDNHFELFGIVGSSPVFQAVLAFVARYAKSDAPVFVYGETGTGKELIARAIHYLSARREKPFVPVNCGALPETLVENELFGHARGAYTDARAEQKGLVALAQGGTLFLDEVDALSRHAQVALLRFLQERRYRPLGSDAAIDADLRIVAATNTDLTARVSDGSFRQDLLFRLDVAPVKLPPLRERGDDMHELADYFLKQFAERYGLKAPNLTPRVRAALSRYAWPGNVRELENAMHRATILAEDGALDHIPMGVLSESATSPVACSPDEQADYQGGLKCARSRFLKRFERDYLRWLLRDADGNISAAARLAGTERRHLGRMIKRLGLSAEAFRPGAVGARSDTA